MVGVEDCRAGADGDGGGLWSGSNRDSVFFAAEQCGSIRGERELKKPRILKKGDEVGRFHMGSTVILFFKKGRVNLGLEPNQVLRMGESIGSIRKSS